MWSDQTRCNFSPFRVPSVLYVAILLLKTGCSVLGWFRSSGSPNPGNVQECQAVAMIRILHSIWEHHNVVYPHLHDLLIDPLPVETSVASVVGILTMLCTPVAHFRFENCTVIMALFMLN